MSVEELILQTLTLNFPKACAGAGWSTRMPDREAGNVGEGLWGSDSDDDNDEDDEETAVGNCFLNGVAEVWL